MGRRVKTKFFECALVDEVQLAEEAKAALAAYPNRPLTAKQVIQLGEEKSPDVAARAFYESLLLSENSQFINELRSHATNRVAHTANIKLLIVPGMFYKEHPEMGGCGLLIREIGLRFGFDVELMPTYSTGSVTNNARVIAEQLAKQTHSRLWLVSISKGTGDLCHYLQNYTMNPIIKGCINIAGIPKGVLFADRKLSTLPKKIGVRLLCRLLGVEYQAINEMRASHPFWKKQNWPAALETIQIQPIPHSAHLHAALRPKYHITLPLGANDGFIPLTDVLTLPGKILPLWGCDHFLRTHKMSAYLYQLFNYMAKRAVK